MVLLIVLFREFELSSTHSWISIKLASNAWLDSILNSITHNNNDNLANRLLLFVLFFLAKIRRSRERVLEWWGELFFLIQVSSATQIYSACWILFAPHTLSLPFGKQRQMRGLNAICWPASSQQAAHSTLVTLVSMCEHGPRAWAVCMKPIITTAIRHNNVRLPINFIFWLEFWSRD